MTIAEENITTTDEQRTTSWMTHNSLPDYLDPKDPSGTIEGHPAPRRATLVAKKTKTIFDRLLTFRVCLPINLKIEKI